MSIEGTRRSPTSPVVQSPSTFRTQSPMQLPNQEAPFDRSVFDPRPTSSAAPISPLATITTDPATFVREGARGPQVEELQKKLKEAGFDPGPLDGKFGPKTRAALLAFQQARGLQADGIVGPLTKNALMSPPAATPDGGPATPPTGTPSKPAATDPAAPMGTSATAKALEAEALQKHGPEFVQKVREMSTRLGIKPEWLLAVMKNESGISTSIQNSIGATGLIQFMPDTARGLGTTTEALAKMTGVQQLEYVEKFFAPNAGKFKSGADLYLNAFWPAAMGKGDDYKIGGAKVAQQNKGFDLDKDGQITAGEFRRYYNQRFPELSQ